MDYDNRQEDPEERLHEHGPAVLSTAELLSVLFSVDRSGSRHCSVEEARVFLDGRDSVSELLHASRDLYCRQFGVVSGPKRHAVLQAGIELYKRCVGECLARGDVLCSPQDVRHYLSMQLTGLEHEVFSILLLDKRHRVIEYRELFQGTIDSAAVYPREVAKLCLARNASAVIFAHYVLRNKMRILWPEIFCCL